MLEKELFSGILHDISKKRIFEIMSRSKMERVRKTNDMLISLLREMLASMSKDILSSHLKIISNHFNDLQFKQDQDDSSQHIVRIKCILSHTICLQRIEEKKNVIFIYLFFFGMKDVLKNNYQTNMK
jgi:hypothetical protein